MPARARVRRISRVGWTAALALWSGIAAAQTTRAASLVESFEAAPNRPLIAPMHSLQAYGGVAGDASILHLGRAFSLPLGGGTGLSRKTELGIDTAVGIVPLSTGVPLSRLRGYGRLLLIEDLMAVQLGVWSPVRPGETLGIEALVPARLDLGRLQLFGQAKTLYQAGALYDVLVAGAAVTGLVEVAGPVYSGIDLGSALMLEGVASGVPTTIAGVGAGAHCGVRVLGNTFAKARFAFPNLTATDPISGAWVGLNERIFELMVVQSLSFKRSKDSEPSPDDPASE